MLFSGKFQSQGGTLPVAAQGWLNHRIEGDCLVIAVGGDWRVSSLNMLDPLLRDLALSVARSAKIDLEGVDKMDTAGAWTIHRTYRDLLSQGITVEYENVRPALRVLLDRIAANDQAEEVDREAPNPLIAMLERMGAAMFFVCREGAELLSFLGATTVTAIRVAAKPNRVRLVAMTNHVERVGLDAIPIVGLLSFLIGIVLAFQGADQLRRFGAEIFTVDLLGVAMLREMAILLTAIVVAGRSGSAFTAQIGTMQVNQEIDAMRTLGLDPMEILVLPRIFALLVALPLLAVFANFMGIAGGMLMSLLTLDISLVQFVERFRTVVPLSMFWAGLAKAPVFGFVIALVGCREGMNVSGSAESVGLHTTRAVVISIFLVIIIDAIFSVIYSFMGI